MKPSALAGLSLTLFMLLLVLTAAFVFLFQGRQLLGQRVDTLTTDVERAQQEILQTGANLAASEATRATVEASLATAESDTVLLEGQLVESQQTIDELSTRVAELTSELEMANDNLGQIEIEQQQALEALPQVMVASPGDGTTSPLDRPVEFVVVASDAAGVTSITLLIDGEVAGSYEVNGETLFVVRETWAPPSEGEYTIGATAMNGSGATGEATAITIQVTGQASSSGQEP